LKRLLVTTLALAAALTVYTGASASTTRPLPPLQLPAATLTAPADPNSFDFVAGGDNRPASHGEPMTPSTSEIFTEMGLLGAPFAIWTGDAIEGYDDSKAEVDGEYASFKSLAALARTPIVAIPGNHEIGFDPSFADRYIKDMGPLYGSFDYGNSHFIGLDSTPVESDGKIHEGTIDPDQLTWLKADLAANQDAANIFVFFHHYMYGPSDPDSPKASDTGLADTATRDMLHQLFVQYHVRAVFNGHEHMFRHVIKDGIEYFIAGNAGAPLDVAPEDGGFLGYTLVHVTGKTIGFQNLTPWTLIARTVSGNDGIAKTAVIALDTYEYGDIALNGVTVDMPTAPSYTVSAASSYKSKSTTVPVSVVRVDPGPNGTSTVVLSLKAKAHKTTMITVTAAPS
jgi:hypothetical protein